MVTILEHLHQLELLPREVDGDYLVDLLDDGSFLPEHFRILLGVYVRRRDTDRGTNAQHWYYNIRHPQASRLPLQPLLDWLATRQTLTSPDRQRLADLLPTSQLIQPVAPVRYPIHPFQRKFAAQPGTKGFVPLAHHLSCWEAADFGPPGPVNRYEQRVMEPALQRLNTTGIGIDPAIIHGIPQVRSGVLYPRYRLGAIRPTVQGTGLNVLGLAKGSDRRKAIRPRNDFFREFDLSQYHLQMAARLSGERLDYDVYDRVISRFYPGQPEARKLAKAHVMRELYGEAARVPNVVDGEIDQPWMERFRTKFRQQYEQEGAFISPLSGARIAEGEQLPDQPFNHKLLAHLLQRMETEVNCGLIRRFFTVLEPFQTKLVLYVFDSFLFDVAASEAGEVLPLIRSVFAAQHWSYSEKQGLNFDELSAVDALTVTPFE